jgi:hypothetical protein
MVHPYIFIHKTQLESISQRYCQPSCRHFSWVGSFLIVLVEVWKKLCYFAQFSLFSLNFELMFIACGCCCTKVLNEKWMRLPTKPIKIKRMIHICTNQHSTSWPLYGQQWWPHPTCTHKNIQICKQQLQLILQNFISIFLGAHTIENHN